MKKQNTHTTSNQTQDNVNSKPNSLNLYESFNGYSAKVPRIRTVFENNELIISVFQTHRKIFEVRTIVNKILNFGKVILTLQKAAIEKYQKNSMANG